MGLFYLRLKSDRKNELRNKHSFFIGQENVFFFCVLNTKKNKKCIFFSVLTTKKCLNPLGKWAHTNGAGCKKTPKGEFITSPQINKMSPAFYAMIMLKHNEKFST